jgi:hypothetical protein
MPSQNRCEPLPVTGRPLVPVEAAVASVVGSFATIVVVASDPCVPTTPAVVVEVEPAAVTTVVDGIDELLPPTVVDVVLLDVLVLVLVLVDVDVAAPVLVVGWALVVVVGCVVDVVVLEVVDVEAPVDVVVAGFVVVVAGLVVVVGCVVVVVVAGHGGTGRSASRPSVNVTITPVTRPCAFGAGML